MERIFSLWGQLKRLFRGLINQNFRIGVTYALGDFMVMGTRFALSILYALYLTAAEYGVLAVAISISTLMGVLITLGLKGAAFKQSFDYAEPKQQRRFFGTLWIFLIGFSTVVTVSLDQIFLRSGMNLFSKIDYSPYIRLALWIGYLNIFGVILYEIYRAKKRPGLYAAMAFGNAATLVGLVFVFASTLGQGLGGVLDAMLITGIIWAAIFSFAMLPYIAMAFDADKLRKALAYSLPLLPHFAGHWVLNLSDRLILERSVNLSEVGVFSLGYNFGNAQQVISNSGNSTLMPYYASAQADEQKINQLPGLFSRYLQVMAVLTLGVALFSDLVIRLVVGPQYQAAGGIVPWVAVGFFFLALYYGPMNTVTLLAGQTKFVWLITLAAGAFNVLANIVLVPRYGIIAAAVNTTLGYALLFLLVYLYSLRVKRTKYDWRGIGMLLLGLAMSLVADRLLEFDAVWLEALMDAAVFIAFTGAVFGKQFKAAWGKAGGQR